MVGFAFAALYPDGVSRFVLIDAPLPGVGPWEEILKNPLLWHFRFGGRDMERLVAGRERIYLDRFWNEFSATPARFSEAARAHYSKLYAMPGAMHSGFMQFAAFDQDAIDNQQFLAKGKLPMPVLAIGGEKSFGTTMAKIMRFAATDVALVALHAAVGGVAGVAVLEYDFHTVDAAVAFIDEGVVVGEAIGERNTVRRVGAGPINQIGDELFVLRKGRRMECGSGNKSRESGPNRLSIHWLLP
jgi:pimeloyl-ACP methyl ester carboxylesterase